MATILIIDDDPEICETIKSLLVRLSHYCGAVHSLQEARMAVARQGYDVVFLDVRLPDGNGLDLLPDITGHPDSPEVIILTGKGDPDGAELAIKGGVWDYLLKPSSVREITLTLNRALRYREEKRGYRDEDVLVSSRIIGKSPEIQTAGRLMAQAARSEANLLITGETGTGKEVFAKAIHENSSRKAGSFVVVDCASLTETLVESTLFGHRKGAFTDAHENRTGLIKAADRGTLFLDEIGEMPLSIQKTFLRVLQERTFRAIGETQEQTSDFRLIAASNRDLEEMVERGGFRSDLLYRIKTMMINLPSLRERTGDIRLLATHKAKRVCEQYGWHRKRIANDFYDVLERYDWPGNVRELFNVIERAVVAAGKDNELFAMHLPRSLRVRAAKDQIRRMAGGDPAGGTGQNGYSTSVRKIGHDAASATIDGELPQLKAFKETAEKAYLCELIRRGNGDIRSILHVSGLSRSHLYALLKKHRLSLQSE